MPLFKCSKCGCLENTSLGNYWGHVEKLPICSECDTGHWHGEFEKRSPEDAGYVEWEGERMGIYKTKGMKTNKGQEYWITEDGRCTQVNATEWRFLRRDEYPQRCPAKDNEDGDCDTCGIRICSQSKYYVDVVDGGLFDGLDK